MFYAIDSNLNGTIANIQACFLSTSMKNFSMLMEARKIKLPLDSRKKLLRS
jgi:hypothetical protein